MKQPQIVMLVDGKEPVAPPCAYRLTGNRRCGEPSVYLLVSDQFETRVDVDSFCKSHKQMMSRVIDPSIYGWKRL